MSNSSQRAAPASVPTRATDSPDVKRRRFLLALGAGGAGAAAVATAANSALARPVMQAASPDEAETSQGYRETDHVRDYYATTRI
jgi:shikimate 5-dehydrogenase